jgi:hypothetical protein
LPLPDEKIGAVDGAIAVGSPWACSAPLVAPKLVFHLINTVERVNEAVLVEVGQPEQTALSKLSAFKLLE